MSKHAFWQALVFTVIVFSLGMILGFFLEMRQSGQIYNDLVNSELNILDEQIRQRLITDTEVSCELSKESLFSFADKIYEEARSLEDLDGTGRISDLTALHKRYDLLRTSLLLEAQNLKKRCNEDFHIVNFLYLYTIDDIGVSSRQDYFSTQVFDLKLNHPDDVILIPIAVDTGVASVELLVESLGVNQFPVIIIDGAAKITELIPLEELEEIVF